jgi:hypothetical protein
MNACLWSSYIVNARLQKHLSESSATLLQRMNPTIPDPNIKDDAEDDSENEPRSIPRYMQANTYNDLQKTVLDAIHEAYQRRLSS